MNKSEFHKVVSHFKTAILKGYKADNLPKSKLTKRRYPDGFVIRHKDVEIWWDCYKGALYAYDKSGHYECRYFSVNPANYMRTMMDGIDRPRYSYAMPKPHVTVIKD